MSATIERRAWVSRVLQVDLRGDADGRGPPDAGEAGLFDKLKDLVTDVTSAVTGTDPRKDRKKDILARLARLADPAAATTEEKKGFKTERDAVTAQLAGETPPEPNLDAAEAALNRLSQLIEASARRTALNALDTSNPAAATQARETFGKFDAVLGTTAVTPELIKQAGEERAAKAKELADAFALVQKAKAMPAGRQKTAAVTTAEQRCAAAKTAFDTVAERENAMVGRTSLTHAITHGPLSAESGNPFKDPQTAKKLVAAYGRDARMADSAVTSASSAKYPDAIADAVGPMITRAQGGFAAANGKALDNPETAQKYGQDLLKMGGNAGPAYFARLPDYIASGQQFTANGTGGEGATTWTEMAQKRSVTLAGKLVKPDGSADVTSDGAKAAIGNLLYHPDAMRNPQPALAAHVLKTVDVLADPVTGPQAGTVLKNATAPTNPSAKTLVGKSLGKAPTDPVSDTDTRTAVLAAMLKPLDQGPVGSCFATAPTRRMRETRPIEAMQAYADIASKGTYKPAFGAEVPAVTNLPPGEDPLMRSWEYTTATATARNANSSERTTFASNVAKGTDLLKAAAVKHEAAGDKDAAWTTKKRKLTKDVADAFTFTYDPMSKITSSSDGKSSQGRYVVERVSDKKAITSQADFEDAMVGVALASLGLAAGTPDGDAVAALVKSPAFIAKVCPGDYKPWALDSGGQTTEATKTLFGDTLQQKNLLPEAGKPPPPEGDRTKAVLASLLKNFHGDSSPMVTIRTVGQHGFNALPNDPSLAPLKGANDTETAQKIQANLVDKGTAMKNTDLAPERAAWLFDQAITKEAGAEKDAALKALIETGASAHRPNAATKPAALAKAIADALAAYHEAAAGQRADAWKADEVTAGRTPNTAAVAKRKTEIKASLDKHAQTGAKNALMKDMGAPQFIIADSNWGDSRDHTFFVVAPDPTTGDPILWQKTEPPGTMSPAGREWVDKEWASIQ